LRDFGKCFLQPLTVAYKLLILVVQPIKQPTKQLMAIPSVVQGLIETEGGKVFELDSPKGAAWVEAIGSFRFEPAGNGKAYTVRKEASGYWYGCRKIAGKVRKKYIGKTSEVSTAKLEEIAEALEVPPVARIGKVAEVAQKVAQSVQVTEKVAEVAEDRLTALELEVANLRKALEAIREALPGKLESGDSTELPKVADKVDDKVAEGLQNELGNLKTENENLRRSLENSDRLVSKKNQEISELNSRLAATNQKISDLDEELSERFNELKRQDAEIENLKSETERLESELARRSGENSEKSATASDLPEAADLLNQLKTKRKKSTATLADIEAILEMIEES
jgi:chromosome segregation ATPase